MSTPLPPNPIGRQCQTPRYPANGYFTGDTNPPYNNGRTIPFSCNDCFTGSGFMQCTPSGSWNMIGACSQAPPCSDPGQVRNAVRNLNPSTWTCGLSVSFGCNLGYSPSGPTLSTCQSNQRWNPRIDQISCITGGCPDPGDVIYSTRSPGYRNLFNPLEIVRYTCLPCYTGSKSVTCFSGVWIGQPVTCTRLSCPNLTVNPQLVYTFSGYSCGTIISFSCIQGFQLVGPASIQCVQSNDQTAQWTNQPPTCQPVQPNPIVPPTIPSIGGSGTTASLVVIGGLQKMNNNDEGISMNTVDFYELDSTGSITWSHQGRFSPVVWTAAGATVRSRDIYILGGHIYGTHTGWTHDVFKYNIDDDSWERLPNITRMMVTNNPPVFSDQNKLYVISYDITWLLDLSQADNGWTEEDIKLPYRVYGLNIYSTVVGDRVFIIGKARGNTKSLISLQIGTNDPWRSHSDMNKERRQDSICTVSDNADRIWVMGHCHRCPWPEGLLELYQVSTDTWTTLNAGPDVSFSQKHNIFPQVCGYYNGYIYAVFSEIYNSGLDRRFHIFNTATNTWSISQTQLAREVYYPTAAVVP